MNQPTTLTDVNFDHEVLDSDRPVIVDFWAPWCGPCRAVGPTIDDLARQYGDEVKVGKLNVDQNPQTSSQFGIQSIPAVLIFRAGQVVETLIGVQSKQRYEDAVQKVAA